jgi:hypothetical protein
MALNLRSLILLLTPLLMAGTPDGIRPRASATDYAAYESVGGITVAASAIPPGQVRKLFATDLNKAGYLVFEVAIYPEQGKTVDLNSGDFMLKIGSDGTTIRAASPQAIASVLRQKNTPPTKTAQNLDVRPTAEVGYESGAYDPVTGRRTHGWYTDTGVAVGPGNPQDPNAPRAGSSDRDQWATERELEDKALPAGTATQPVAGYLYFPKSGSKKGNALYQLNWYSDTAKVSISVPPPPKP